MVTFGSGEVPLGNGIQDEALFTDGKQKATQVNENF